MWPYTDEENDFISSGKLPENEPDEVEQQASEETEAA